MTDIALFPIPDCVTFPGCIFPLHVFEPRYRSMVAQCTREALPMGICHTMGVLRAGKNGQSVEEALKSNQSTYKPYRIFSAGPCELMDTLDDGRLLIQVHLEARYEVVEVLQSLPFVIASCREYCDEPLNSSESEVLLQLKEKVLRRLLALTSRQRSVYDTLQSTEWQDADPLAFSLQVFGLVQFDADVQQGLLESRSPVMRLESVLQALNAM